MRLRRRRGTAAQLLFPPRNLPLPERVETQAGWAACPPELLARALALVASPPCGLPPAAASMAMSRLHHSAAPHLLAVRLVCRAWRRVHDERVVAFLKPAALYTESLAAHFPALLALDLSRCKYPDRGELVALLGRLRSLRRGPRPRPPSTPLPPAT